MDLTAQLVVSALVVVVVIAVIGAAVSLYLDTSNSANPTIIRLRRCKTVLIGAITSIAGTLLFILEQAHSLPLDTVLPSKYLPFIMFGYGFVMIVLRAIIRASQREDD